MQSSGTSHQVFNVYRSVLLPSTVPDKLDLWEHKAPFINFRVRQGVIIEGQVTCGQRKPTRHLSYTGRLDPSRYTPIEWSGQKHLNGCPDRFFLSKVSICWNGRPWWPQKPLYRGHSNCLTNYNRWWDRYISWCCVCGRNMMASCRQDGLQQLPHAAMVYIDHGMDVW